MLSFFVVIKLYFYLNKNLVNQKKKKLSVCVYSLCERNEIKSNP